MSRIFHPCKLVPQNHVSHFQVLHFWPSRIFMSRIFSRPDWIPVAAHENPRFTNPQRFSPGKGGGRLPKYGKPFNAGLRAWEYNTCIHTNLYSAKNRENESEALAEDDYTVKADWNTAVKQKYEVHWKQNLLNLSIKCILSRFYRYTTQL